MRKNKNEALLEKLEAARGQAGAIQERDLVRLLSAAGRVSFGKDSQSLIRFHELLLFFRAFPAGARVLRLADALLGGLEKKIKVALAGGADPDDFTPEEFAGIAGTVVEATFSYPMVCWLVRRFPRAISIN